jgi:hypothetical protein
LASIYGRNRNSPWRRTLCEPNYASELCEPRHFVVLQPRTRGGEGEFQHLSLCGHGCYLFRRVDELGRSARDIRKLFGALVLVGADSQRRQSAAPECQEIFFGRR